MTIHELLPQLESVRLRGNGRWSARCPGHADKSPSLSVSEGEKGILLKCWVGCTLAEICRGLGIEQRDLFFDALVKPQRGQRQAPPVRIDRRALAFQFELGALDLRLRAERIAQAAIHVEIGRLSDVELDRAFAFVGQGFADTERAVLFEGVADGMRFKEFHERGNRERPRAA